MTYQPPIQPMYPGGNREQTQAWEDLLGLLNQQYRNEFQVTVPCRAAWPGILNVAAVDSLSGTEPGYVVNRSSNTALSATALSTNTMRAVPWVCTTGWRISKVSINITVAGGAGSKARLLLYASRDDRNGNWAPWTLLWRGDEIDGTGTGLKSTTTYLELEPGRVYWWVYWCGTAAPTVNTVPVASVNTYAGSGGGTGTTMVTVASTYSSATIPKVFPTGGVTATTVPPAIVLTMTRPSTVTGTSSTLGWTAPYDGAYALRRVWLTKASALSKNPTNFPSVTVNAYVANAGKKSLVGAFDSRTGGLGAVVPRLLSNSDDLSLGLKRGDVLLVETSQIGWPPIDVGDATVQFDIGVL